MRHNRSGSGSTQAPTRAASVRKSGSDATLGAPRSSWVVGKSGKAVPRSTLRSSSSSRRRVKGHGSGNGQSQGSDSGDSTGEHGTASAAHRLSRPPARASRRVSKDDGGIGFYARAPTAGAGPGGSAPTTARLNPAGGGGDVSGSCDVPPAPHHASTMGMRVHPPTAARASGSTTPRSNGHIDASSIGPAIVTVEPRIPTKHRAPRRPGSMHNVLRGSVTTSARSPRQSHPRSQSNRRRPGGRSVVGVAADGTASVSSRNGRGGTTDSSAVTTKPSRLGRTHSHDSPGRQHSSRHANASNKDAGGEPWVSSSAHSKGGRVSTITTQSLEYVPRVVTATCSTSSPLECL